MDKVLRFFNTTMIEPQPFGSFHLVSILFLLVLTVCLCFFFRNADQKTFRTILILIWCVMAVWEAGRQILWSGTINEDGTVSWAYNWGAFPFQLCDAPFYCLLPIAFLKDGKIRDALACYMCTFVLIGGLATYAVPESVFTPNLFLNYDTMIHHGLQIASAAFIAVRFRSRLNLRVFASAFVVFLLAVGIATGLNVGLHARYPDQYVNLFFISPYYKEGMPVFTAAWQEMGLPMMLFVYCFVMTMFSSFVYLVWSLAFYRSDPRAAAWRGGRAVGFDGVAE